MSLFPPFELVTYRHGNNHDNHRDMVHVILTKDVVDGDDDDDDDGDGEDDTEAMKEI